MFIRRFSVLSRSRKRSVTSREQRGRAPEPRAYPWLRTTNQQSEHRNESTGCHPHKRKAGAGSVRERDDLDGALHDEMNECRRPDCASPQLEKMRQWNREHDREYQRGQSDRPRHRQEQDEMNCANGRIDRRAARQNDRPWRRRPNRKPRTNTSSATPACAKRPGSNRHQPAGTSGNPS